MCNAEDVGSARACHKLFLSTFISLYLVSAFQLYLFKLWDFTCPQLRYDYEARRGAGLWNFDHLRFLNVHSMHNTLTILYFVLIEMWPPWLGFDSVPLGFPAQCQSHNGRSLQLNKAIHFHYTFCIFIVRFFIWFM